MQTRNDEFGDPVSRDSELLRAAFSSVNVSLRVQDHQSRINISDAAHFLRLLMDPDKGVQYRASFALSIFLRQAGKHTVPTGADAPLAEKRQRRSTSAKRSDAANFNSKLFLSGVRGTFRKQCWFDINTAVGVESFFNNGTGVATHFMKQKIDERNKQVCDAMSVSMKRAKSNGEDVSADMDHNSTLRKSLVVTIRRRVEQALLSRELRSATLCRGLYDTALTDETRDYFSPATGKVHVAYYNVFTLPESMLSLTSVGELGESLGELRPDQVTKAVRELLHSHAGECAKVLSTSGRFPPVEHYGSLWPVQFMRAMTSLLKTNCEHSFDALAAHIGEPVCQVAFGNHMMSTFRAVSANFAQAMFDAIARDPSVVLRDNSLRSVLKKVVSEIEAAVQVYERTGKHMPNTTGLVEEYIWNVNGVSEVTKERVERRKQDTQELVAHLQQHAKPAPASTQSARDMIASDKSFIESVRRVTSETAKRSNKRHFVCPVVDMFDSGHAAWRVPCTLASLVPAEAASSGRTLQQLVDDDTLGWHTTSKHVRALCAVHARSGIYEVAFAARLHRTPQEYAASILGGLTSSSILTKRGGGGTGNDDASLDDDDEDDGDGDNPEGALKRRKVSSVDQARSVQQIKRIPVTNVTQVADEMGFVRLNEKDSAFARASELDIELLADAAVRRGQCHPSIDKMRAWYVEGAHTSLSVYEYIKSIDTSKQRPMLLTNEPAGFNGAKLTNALVRVARLARIVCDSTESK